MNDVVNTFWLVGDKFLPELDFRQLGFTYCSFVLFTKYHTSIHKFKEASDLNNIHKKELEKAWFAYDAAIANAKVLAKKTLSDSILKHKSCEITPNLQYDGIKEDWQIWCISVAIR